MTQSSMDKKKRKQKMLGSRRGGGPRARASMETRYRRTANGRRRMQARRQKLERKQQQQRRTSETRLNLALAKRRTKPGGRIVRDRLDDWGLGPGGLPPTSPNAEWSWASLATSMAIPATTTAASSSRIDKIAQEAAARSHIGDAPLGPAAEAKAAPSQANSSRRFGGDASGAPLAQVHRLHNRSERGRALALAHGAAKVASIAPVTTTPRKRNIAFRSLLDRDGLPPPKLRSTFSINERRAYLLAGVPLRKIRAESLIKKADPIVQSASNTISRSSSGSSRNSSKEEAENSIPSNENGNGPHQARPGEINRSPASDDYLLRIKTLRQRGKTIRILNDTSEAPFLGLDTLRPPVQRLKSMPPSNQKGSHTNNRPPVTRRRSAGVYAGSDGGAGLSVTMRPRATTNQFRPIRDACNSTMQTTAGREQSSRYLTRQRLAQVNMARAAYGAGLVQPSPVEAALAAMAINREANQPTINHQRRHATNHLDEMDQMRRSSRPYQWHWSEKEKSHECVVNKDRLSLCLHPNSSESTAACLAAEPLRRNGNYYYWEIQVHDKIYGTSVMFGLCSNRQRMHANDYCNLIGLDDCGWSLSHKGLAWHNGLASQYTSMFPVNQPITIGLLYDTMRGELSYFMDGKNLGVAFRGLNDFEQELYPVVASTARCTQMTLVGSYCGYVSLLERSCFTLLKSVGVKDRHEFIEQLRQQNLPKQLLQYVAQAANVNWPSITSRRHIPCDASKDAK